MWPSRVSAEAEPSPPLRLTVVAPKPAPAVPRAKVSLRRGRGGIAEIAIGREAPPVLVAAIEQVEQHGAANERHADVADGKPAAAVRAGGPARPSRRRGRRRSRRTAPRRRCARPCGAARAGRSRACRARRRARRRAATAGSSNTMAVTPDASRASSACPTRMPATSVIRLRATGSPRRVGRSRLIHSRAAHRLHVALPAMTWTRKRAFTS